MLRGMPQLGGQRLSPIPASVLSSTMEVLSPTESEFGAEYGEPRVIRHVRFVRSTELSVSAPGGLQAGYVFQDGSKGLVLVDAATSEGAFEVPERAEVSIDGGDALHVVKVTRCDNLDGSVHHWEVEVA